jgi:hypothetical protein
MAPTPTVDAGAYQTLSELRKRIDYDGESLFQENAQLQFDKLLVRLERESRGIFETLWGDETVLEETDRTDIKRATDDAALLMPYPVNDVSEVEIKHSQNDDWDTLDEEHWDFTEHRLVLARRSNNNSLRHQRHANPITAGASRATWRDLCVKIRVTFDRGFGSDPPADVTSIQVELVNRMLRRLRQEQTVAAASPEDFAGVAENFDDVVTDAIRDRISDVTSPGAATLSI